MMLKSLLIAAACAGAALAQTISLTSFPPPVVQVGQAVTLTWQGGNNSPVTIKLRQGIATDLKDVSTLTTSATGGSYTWTPASTLVNGAGYAIQIEQGSDINYSGLFAVAGGASSSASASASSVTSALSSLSSAASSASSVLSSIVASVTAMNSTVSAMPTAMSNSTTFRSTSASSTRSSGSSATSSGSGSSASSTGGATGASSNTNAAAGLGSPVAFVLCAVAAIMYLN